MRVSMRVSIRIAMRVTIRVTIRVAMRVAMRNRLNDLLTKWSEGRQRSSSSLKTLLLKTLLWRAFDRTA